MSQPVSLKPPHLGLDDDALALVGKIILQWGQAEFYIGLVLAQLFGAAGPASQLVQSLGFSKKVDLLVEHGTEDRLGREGRRWVLELRHAKEHFRRQRDTLAHGSAQYGGPSVGGFSIAAVARPHKVAGGELASALERAEYAATAAVLLVFCLQGDGEKLVGPARPTCELCAPPKSDKPRPRSKRGRR